MRMIIVSCFVIVAVAACEKKAAEGTPADHSGHAASADHSGHAASADHSGHAPPATPNVGTGKQVAVAVGEDGFAPNEVKVAKGEATTLVFTRSTDKTCAKEVEFPDLKLKKELPLNQPVAVVVPSGEARTLTFQCGMGMYKSKVVVQ